MVTVALCGGTVEMYETRLRVNWKPVEKVTVSIGFEYENGTELDASQEHFSRLGPEGLPVAPAEASHRCRQLSVS